MKSENHPAENLTRVTVLPALPDRPAEGHKGLFGRVLVVGGNDGMIGAAAFAGTAALRMGSGLVQLAVPRSILGYCLTITPELIGLGLRKASGKDALLDAGQNADAIVIGPGMGRTPEAHARLVRLARLDKPMVVDADGLNMIATEKRWPSYFKARAVLTPHPGEMARLGKLIGRKEVPSDDEGRIGIAVEAARSFGQVILLKGHRTVVTDGTRVYLNHTGDSTLSKAGTGDVLSGIIGSLLGQKVDRFDAAVLGAHLHGLAGRLGRRCALAREVLDAIPEALKTFESGQ
jgi:ADP-dependent NAD(P)H-hydrate dehydratase